ncbi:hypothetical protein COU61_01415 [Candidatus Pacearchaeota archaeon CG10_big_fil_rev_8_21_14_0_10_35_13]|nr:MAG: hypothetical protein COU61_01415 [Candidatus Pacearchaeota archaeon CG10_big_fil_rev_8_21_14_0_10_35_13]
MTFNVDFKNYGGAIGLQSKWLEIQGISESSLTSSLVDRSIDGGVDAVVITSMHDDPIAKGSVHDRFSYFANPDNHVYFGRTDDVNPLVDSMGKPSGRAVKVRRDFERSDNGVLYLIKGQVVQTKLHDDGDRSKALDILAVGIDNYIEPFQHPEAVVADIQYQGGLVIADNRLLTDLTKKSLGKRLVIAHNRLLLNPEGSEWFYDHSGSFDAVLGHYARHKIPPIFARGPLRSADRDINDITQRVARWVNLPWVSASGAKFPSEHGITYSSITSNPRVVVNDCSFFDYIREALTSKKVMNHEGVIGIVDFLRDSLAWRKGLKLMAKGVSLE